MVPRCLAVAVCAFVLSAADYPPPPEQLEPYTEEGRFDPGDFAWMKGRFQDATPEEAAAFRAIVDWSMACRDAALAELRTQLAAEGFPAARLENVFAGPMLCSQVAFQPMILDNSSFAAFQQEAAQAEPVTKAFLAATRLAEETVRPPAGADLARQLIARTLVEQILRRAFTWGLGMEPDSPDLSPLGRAVFQSRISAEVSVRDHANTAWLKGVVAEQGWPKISEVGEEASTKAWLLVQHADRDPLFQLQVLRLMEPLVAEGEVSKQNYAYLYDRIMLKLAGKQRYATQVMCQGGVRQPLPLEHEADVDGLRAEMGLGTVAEYIGGMNNSIPCEGLPENSVDRGGKGAEAR